MARVEDGDFPSFFLRLPEAIWWFPEIGGTPKSSIYIDMDFPL